jgi:hypothetical protein
MNPEQRKLCNGFKYETDAELDQKRGVYLDFIVGYAQDQANIQAKRCKLADFSGCASIARSRRVH